jgi:hypothetical protein
VYQCVVGFPVVHAVLLPHAVGITSFPSQGVQYRVNQYEPGLTFAVLQKRTLRFDVVIDFSNGYFSFVD